jgi:hypothetical protein
LPHKGVKERSAVIEMEFPWVDIPESVDTKLGNLHVRAIFAKSVGLGVVFPSSKELQCDTESFQTRVYDFFPRNFTFDSDAVDAIRGILAMFEGLPKAIHYFFRPPCLFTAIL